MPHFRVTDFVPWFRRMFPITSYDYVWVKFIIVWYDFYFSGGLSRFPHDFLFDNRSLQEKIQWTRKLSLVDSLAKNAIQLSPFSFINFDIFISFLITNFRYRWLLAFNLHHCKCFVIFWHFVNTMLRYVRKSLINTSLHFCMCHKLFVVPVLCIWNVLSAVYRH